MVARGENMKKVMWICDTKGWAFDNKAMTLIRQMPEYEHYIYYTYKMRESPEFYRLCAVSDVIVCLSLYSAVYVPKDCKGKTVMLISGHRFLSRRLVFGLYYTDNCIDGTPLADVVRYAMLGQFGKSAISVSQRPLPSLGRNICVGEMPRQPESILKQILRGLEEVPDSAYVFMVEHDVIYDRSHYIDAPIKEAEEDTVYYNVNVYRCIEGGFSYHERSPYLLSQCGGLAGTLKKAFTEILNAYRKNGVAYCLEPCRDTQMCKWGKIVPYKSAIPSVDIRHDKCFSTNRLTVTYKEIPYWGGWQDVRRSVGLAVPENTSGVVRKLNESAEYNKLECVELGSGDAGNVLANP